MVKVLRRALSTGLAAASLIALPKCDEGPINDRANTLRFTSSAIIWQRNGGEISSVFLVESLGGRLFALITARGSDGNEAVFQSERVGGTWELPFQLPRPGGAASERVEWTLSAPTPVVVTVGTSGGSGAAYTREFNGNSWMVPFAATFGSEAPSMVRIAAGSPGGPGRRTLHLAYATTGSGCASAMTLVHRVSFTLGQWQGQDTIATACDPKDLGFAVSRAPGDPLVALWNAASPGGARVLDYAYSRTGFPSAFGPVQRVPLVQGEPMDTRAVAVGQSPVLATWLQSGSPRRAAYSVFDPVSSAWTAPEPNWFVSSLAPWIAEEPIFRTALVIASETDAPFTRLMLRRWQSVGRPIALSSVVRAPSGGITSPRVITRSDASVHAAWIEAPGNGSVAQVWWSSAEAALPDAGSVFDAR